jgi:L-ascorbate peroxidase
MQSSLRLQRLSAHITLNSTAADEHVSQLKGAKAAIASLIAEKDCNPIMVRLAWHDSGTYDQNNANAGAWPSGNGAVGTIRFDKEITAGPNAGLDKALGYLKPVKAVFPLVSWADLIQMGSAVAIEVAGGPKIDMIYGREDAAATPDHSEAPFGLPDALPPFGGPDAVAKDPAAHLRFVFNKYDNMSDKDIVALSGAHTLGRAFKDRSGTVDNGYTSPTKYTSALGGMKGGKSWTKQYLTFDNSYFQMEGSEDSVGVLLIWQLCQPTLDSPPAFTRPHTTIQNATTPSRHHIVGTCRISHRFCPDD